MREAITAAPHLVDKNEYPKHDSVYRVKPTDAKQAHTHTHTHTHTPIVYISNSTYSIAY